MLITQVLKDLENALAFSADLMQEECHDYALDNVNKPLHV